MRMQVVNRNKDRKLFNTARRTHPRNVKVANTRGGVRM